MTTPEPAAASARASAGDVPTGDPIGRLRTSRITWAIAATILVVLLVVAARRLDLARAATELVQAKPAWVLAAALLYLTILPLWAAEWYLLAPATPLRTPRNMLGVVAMTSSAMNTMPMIVGETVALYLLSARAGIETAAGVAVLAMDQLFVGLAKLAVLAGAALLLPMPVWMANGAKALVLAVALLLAGVLAVAWGGDPVRRLIAKIAPASFVPFTIRATLALAPLRSPARTGALLLLALLKKSAELLAIIAIQNAFGIALPASSALLVLAALSIATMLPLVPGNVGLWEAAVALAYVHLGVDAERALGMAVVMHCCQFVALALPGYRWLVRAR